MSNSKARSEEIYDECSVIARIRGAYASSFASGAKACYCLKSGKLYSTSPDNSAAADNWSKCEAFYTALDAWKRDNNAGAATTKKLSLEEELLAERHRAATDVEISSVSVVKADDKTATTNASWLLIKRPGSTLLWREGETTSNSICDIFSDLKQKCNNSNNSNSEKMPSATPMDMQIVSATPEALAFTFVAGGNVYVARLALTTGDNSSGSSSVTALTTTGEPGILEFGTPDFILQEEFSRYSGVFLSPAAGASGSSRPRRSVCYTAADIAHTPQPAIGINHRDGNVERIPYPRVGQDNAVSSLFVQELPDLTSTTTTKAANNSTQLRMLPMTAILARFPWVEYIVRIYWLSSDVLALALLSRDQERYALVSIPVSALLPVQDHSSGMVMSPHCTLLMECATATADDSNWFAAVTPNANAEVQIKERLGNLLAAIKSKKSSSNKSNNGDNEKNDAKPATAPNLAILDDPATTTSLTAAALSLTVIRSQHEPRAWIDINDETHLIRSAGSDQCETIVCVAQEIKDNDDDNGGRDDGFFHVFRCDTPLTVSSLPTWKCLSNNTGNNGNGNNSNSKALLPRGLLGAGTRLFNKGRWLLARGFVHNGYCTSLVAIDLKKSSGNSSVGVVTILTGEDVDVPSYNLVTSPVTGKTDLLFNFVPANSEQRQATTGIIKDLAAVLESGAANTVRSESNIELVSFAPIEGSNSAATTSSTSSKPPRTFSDVPRAKVTYFEVPITGSKCGTTEKLQAAYFAPQTDTSSNNNNAKKVPLIIFTYSGPHASVCTANFLVGSGNIEMWRRAGAAVLVFDSRMSTRHSLRCQSDGKRGFGSFEALDCISALDTLIALPNKGFDIDTSRVAATGHSYGGWTSLRFMCDDVSRHRIKLVVAGAPVTSWLLYDTGYTERYAGLLPSDKNYYEESSLCHDENAKRFPDELNRIFIMHGDADENVHFANTAALAEALIKFNKPFAQILYPGERHGIRKTTASAKHYATMTLRIFMELL